MEQQYLYPAIIDVYKGTEKVVRDFSMQIGSPIEVCGDGRFDSIGFNAFWHCYIIIDTRTNLVIGFHLIEKKTGKGSAALEPIAAKVVLEDLISSGLRCTRVVTDHFSSMFKVIEDIAKENSMPVEHEYDIGT